MDIVIDDGAHTNPACVNTIWAALPHISPGGIHLVEDLHTSFNRTFGNPSNTSAFSLGMALAENLSRAYGEAVGSSGSPLELFRVRVTSIKFFPSIMALQYRSSSQIWERPVSVDNGGEFSTGIEDLRNVLTLARKVEGILSRLGRTFPEVIRLFLLRPGAWIVRNVSPILHLLSVNSRNLKLELRLRRQRRYWG